MFVTKLWQRRWVARLCWLYLLVVTAVWLLVRIAGDRWWLATAILFGPRWISLLPLGLLLPLALLVRRRSLGVLALASWIVIVPIMGLCVPWRAAGDTPHPVLRVLTFNTHYKMLDVPGLTALIADTNPDLIALQEWSRGPRSEIFGAERPFIHLDGEFCIASRYPIRLVSDVGSWRQPYAARVYEVETPGGRVHFFNVHLASPHPAFEQALHRSPGWIASINANRDQRQAGASDLQECAARLGGSLLMAGDFNLPADSNVYRQTLSTFSDAFDRGGFGFGVTYHAKWTVTRIDHILAGEGWDVRRCWVGPNLGSPHRPLLADLAWLGDEKR